MSYKQLCTQKRKHDYSFSIEKFDFEKYTNTANISEYYENVLLIWFDKSINKEDPDNRNSVKHLFLVNNSLVIVKDEEECLELINKLQTNANLFLIVSGSSGQHFIPQIEGLSQIISIYVFCARKSYHEYWAKNYKKVKGVYDVITDLCKSLNHDKEIHEIEQIYIDPTDSLSKLSLKRQESTDQISSSNVTHDNHQTNNIIHPSETVTPVVEWKQHMEFADTGIWPCVFFIANSRNEVFTHLHSVLGILHYSNSIDTYLKHIDHHENDPHFVILCDPTNTEHISKLIHPRIQKVYLYQSGSNLGSCYAFSKKYPLIVSVLRHLDVLARLILLNLSTCIVNIGHDYNRHMKTNLAQARYRYAYRLHLSIQEDLRQRIQMIKNTRSIEYNN
ncbi:hypothetical protein I4U23_019650 [Adineta vaga]|nr:hypothetical protein I4U23_019650 [Adineta vaga]